MMSAVQQQSEYGVIRLNGANRRLFPRMPAHGPVKGRRLDHSLQALRHPSLHLELRDLSLGGVSATVDQPLERGERLNMLFPPSFDRPAWDAYGRVVRCDPSPSGWRIGVAFDPLPAA